MSNVEADVKWWIKGFIGALGGFGLALLKLIEAKFYIAAVSNVEIYAAFLTYGAYMLLGSLAAVFLTDHELPPIKVKRSAFILGLLAPSVLLAIANQPFRSGSDKSEGSPQIPPLSSYFVSSANAQESQPVSLGLYATRVIPLINVSPTLSDGLKAALGRKELSPQYFYVVGGTSDLNKAMDVATKANVVLRSSNVTLHGTVNPLTSSVLKSSNGNKFFVVIGGASDKDDVVQYKADATAAATRLLLDDKKSSAIGSSDVRRIAGLLADAPVVPVQTLFQPLVDVKQ